MKKFWYVFAAPRGTNMQNDNGNGGGGGQTNYGPFSTKENAVNYLKTRVAADKNHAYDFYVVEAVVAAKLPVPEVDIIELK